MARLVVTDGVLWVSVNMRVAYVMSPRFNSFKVVVVALIGMPWIVKVMAALQPEHFRVGTA